MLVTVRVKALINGQVWQKGQQMTLLTAQAEELFSGGVVASREQIDPTDGSVITQAQPEQTTVVVLKNGNVSMTIDQWDNWAAGPESEDDDYQLNCISANLGLTRA